MVHDAVSAGIPATVVAAASFDDMIAITGYTIFIDIAIKGEGNQAWAIMHGPVSVVLGILAGLIAAYLCAFTKLWNNRVKRTAVVLLSALFMKFIFDRYNFTSGGALGSLTLGLCVKELWARGKPGMFAIPETNHEYTRNVSFLGMMCACAYLQSSSVWSPVVSLSVWSLLSVWSPVVCLKSVFVRLSS